jgi:hypothetical protein
VRKSCFHHPRLAVTATAAAAAATAATASCCRPAWLLLLPAADVSCKHSISYALIFLCLAAAAAAAVLQATLVLSLLPASCRSADPQLLPALRGELLYMARIIEQPVSCFQVICMICCVFGYANI